MKIEDIMSKNIIIKDLNSSINEISKTMKENDIGFIPINKDKRIVGVITDRDIVTKILANNDNKINNYLSNPIYIEHNSNTFEAIKLMGNKKIKRLLVKKNNKLVGILSISDILSSLPNEILINNIQKIYAISRNDDKYFVSIDEFEL